MSFGGNAYAVAEPGTGAPKDYKPGRVCCRGKKCAGGENDKPAPLNRYETPTDGYLVCNACQREASRADMTVAEFIGKDRKGGRGRRRGPVGKKLPGLDVVMERRKLSNADLARAAGVDRHTVRDLRRLHTAAQISTLEAIAGALGVSCQYLQNRPRGEVVGTGAGRPGGSKLPNLGPLMDAQGMSRSLLAREAGLSLSTVSVLRDGKRGASEETAGKLARALGVSVADLEGGRGE